MSKNNINAILFDLDGVLVDSLNAWCYVFNDTRKYFGFKPLSKRNFIKDFGAPIEQDARKYFKGKTIEEVKNVYNLYFTKRKKFVKLFPQSIDVLKSLKKQKLKIGLITNSTKFITFSILNHFKLKKYFQVIVTMEGVKRRKPAPDMVLEACKMLEVNPTNTILIGDTMNDMIAGKRAGCITIGYKVKGDYTVSKLKEVIRFI